VEELFDVGRFRQLVPLEKGRAALARAIDDQCPDFGATFRDVGLWEDAEEILAHYGAGWQLRNRQRLEAATRELGLFRIDEIIEEVESNGAALVAEERERIDRFIDERLNSTDQGNLADTALLLRHLRKRLAAELDSVQKRATAALPAAPDLSRFDRCYEQFVAAAEHKPARRRVFWWGLGSWGVGTVGLALLLRHLAALFRLPAESPLRVALLPPWAWLTAAGVVGLVLVTFLLWRMIRSTSAIRRFVGESRRARRGSLLQLLDDLSRGPDRSLLSFYGTRFTRACDIWVHRTLAAVLKHVDDRLDRLSRMLMALEQQVKAAHEQLRAGGVEQHADGSHSTAAVLVDAALRRSLVDPLELPRLYEERREPRERGAMVRHFCAVHRPFANWRSELPLADLEPLIDSCGELFESLDDVSVLLQPDLEQQARRRLRRFFRDFSQRLAFHIDFEGRLFADRDGLNRALAASLVVGQPVADIVEEELEAVAARAWEVVREPSKGNRMVLLKLVTGIGRDVIRWHEGPESGAATAEPATAGAAGDADE